MASRAYTHADTHNCMKVISRNQTRAGDTRMVLFTTNLLSLQYEDGEGYSKPDTHEKSWLLSVQRCPVQLQPLAIMGGVLWQHSVFFHIQLQTLVHMNPYQFPLL